MGVRRSREVARRMIRRHGVQWLVVASGLLLVSGFFRVASADMFTSPVGEGFVVTRNFMAQVGTQRHTGVDLANGMEGGFVFAIADGTVVHRQDSTDPSGWGYMMRIEHTLDGQVFYSQYGHMLAGSLTKDVGDPVSKGEIIGRVDCTGRTEGATPCANGQRGPHLHFEIKLLNQNGCGYLPSTNCPDDSFANYFDPLDFINGRNVYVTSFSQGRIYKVDKKSGAKISVASGFTLPEDMTVDENGILYIGGVFVGVKRVDTNENSMLSDVGVNVCGPEGPTLDEAGHLFVNTRLSPCAHSGIWVVSGGVAVTGVQVVRSFSDWGEGMVFLRSGSFAGHLIASDSAGGRIVRIPPTDFGNLLEDPGDFIVGLCVPVGLAVNDGGDVFITDHCLNEIRQYGENGTFKGTFASGLSGPLFLEFDENGNLYVAQDIANNVVKFLSGGGRARLFPGGPFWETSVPQAVGVAVRGQ